MTGATVLVGMMVVALAVLGTAPSAAADNYSVTANPYNVNHTILGSETGHTYEVTASEGQRINYGMTVSTPGGCAELYFVKGHNVNLQQQFSYLIAYSQPHCASSYSGDFPVGPGDGTRFTIVVVNPNTVDVSYGLGINVAAAPAIPTWVLGLLVVIGIVVLGAVVRTAIRRARRPKAMPPIAPPAYAPPPVGPPYPQPPAPFPPAPAQPIPQSPPQQPAVSSPVPDPAAALRQAFLAGRLDRRLYAENLSRSRGLVGDTRAENLVEAFAAEKIDLDLFEKNLGRLGKAPGAPPVSEVRER